MDEKRKQIWRRRILLAALVIAAASPLIWNKVRAEVAVEYDGRYYWVTDPTAKPCDHYVWKKVERSRLPGLCSGASGMATESSSCAFTASCLVISSYSEREAKLIRLGDKTLFAHELEHLKGKVHP